MPKCVSEKAQYCEVEYESIKFSHHLDISILAVKFTVGQLNYIHWCPELFGEIREAAKTHFEDQPEKTT